MGKNPIGDSSDPEPQKIRSLEDFLKSVCEFGIKLEASGLSQIPKVIKLRKSINELISYILELKVDVSRNDFDTIIKSIEDGCEIEDLKIAFENRKKRTAWKKKVA